MYIHALTLIIISLAACIAWSIIDRRRSNYDSLAYWFLVIARYYLAIHLLAYDFNKIFKWQFYLPEPNILFTPMGELSRDLLFWSSMGASRSYSMFSGIIETLAAVLLLFNRTRLPGALISAGAVLYVFMINLSFDISVKLYSGFLLFLSMLILGFDGKRLYRFFIGEKVIMPASWKFVVSNKKQRFIYAGVKAAALMFIFAEALFIYVSTGNFNDDTSPRPLLSALLLSGYDDTLKSILHYVQEGDSALLLR